MSLYKVGEPPGISNDLPDPPSTKTPRRAANNAILFGVVIVLVALLGTQLKGSVTKTMERFGRSLALEGQLSAQSSKTKTNHQ